MSQSYTTEAYKLNVKQPLVDSFETFIWDKYFCNLSSALISVIIEIYLRFDEDAIIDNIFSLTT